MEPIAMPYHTSDGRGFACPVVGCRKTFRRRYTAKEHAATHTGEKAYVCSIAACGRSFTTSGSLGRHVRVQHPWLRAPLDCLLYDCDCSFSSVVRLERHVAMVHFGSAFACSMSGCGCAFTTAANLRRHMRQRHDDSDDDDDDETPMDPTEHYDEIRTTSPAGIEDLGSEAISEVELWTEVASLLDA